MGEPAGEADHVRRRIEAAGFRLAPERADEIVAAAPLLLALTRRVRTALGYGDEPAAVVRLGHDGRHP
jgi:hypothetical protein